MEEKGRVKLVAGIDLIVAVSILITGVFVILFGISFGDFVDMVTRSTSYYSNSNPYSWLTKIPWIINLIGLTTIVYGVKRTIDNMSKFFVL